MNDPKQQLAALTPLPKVDPPIPSPESRIDPSSTPTRSEEAYDAFHKRTGASQTPRSEAAKMAKGTWEPVTIYKESCTLETELKESQARELALREALEQIRQSFINIDSHSRDYTSPELFYWNARNECRAALVKLNALSTPPPPVVWKSQYDADIALLNERNTKDLVGLLNRLQEKTQREGFVAREDADKLAKAIADTLPGMKAQTPPKPGTFNWPHYADVMEKAFEAFRAKYPKKEEA